MVRIANPRLNKTNPYGEAIDLYCVVVFFTLRIKAFTVKYKTKYPIKFVLLDQEIVQ